MKSRLIMALSLGFLIPAIAIAQVGPGPGNGSGTVTSLGITAPSEFTITGSPVTTAGSIAISKATQTQNRVYASPNGSTGAPVFRALVGPDVPAVNLGSTGNGGITGTLPITNGGTGQTSAVPALAALGGAPTASPTLTGTVIVPAVGCGLNTLQAVDATSAKTGCGQRVTPQELTASCDTTGATAADTCIANWLASGKPLSCAGTYKLTTVITTTIATGGSVDVFGASRQGCNFVLAPTASGLGALGSATTIVAAGSNYTLFDIVPLTGGTCSIQPQIQVTALVGSVYSGAGIAAARVWNGGLCTVSPGAASATGTPIGGSSGSGATVTLTYSTQPGPAGFKFNLPAPNFFTTPKLALKNFAMSSAAQIGNAAAISIVQTAGTGATDPNVLISGLDFFPTAAANTTLSCIDFLNVPNVTVRDVTCQSDFANATVSGLVGIRYGSTGTTTTEAMFNNIRIFSADEGFYVWGSVVQGLQFDHVMCITCNRVLHFQPSDGNFIEADISHLDSNFQMSGVLAVNSPNVKIHDSYFNAFGAPPYTVNGQNLVACLYYIHSSGYSINDDFHDNYCQEFQSTSTGNRVGLYAINYGAAGATPDVLISHHNQYSSVDFGEDYININWFQTDQNQFNAGYISPMASAVTISNNSINGVIGTNSYVGTITNPLVISSSAAVFGEQGLWPLAKAPACNGSVNGSRWLLSDSSTLLPTYNSTAAGGGTNSGTIVCDGFNWVNR